MALGWLSILSSVPWTEVIANAPRVAEGAKRLWNAVGGKPAPTGGGGRPGAAADPAVDLATRLQAAETALAELHQQMLASSALIKDLAEQNTRLVEGIEAERRYGRRLAGLLLVVAVVALAGLVLALLR